jgi:glucuronoarabinoxylan endo-1,4-beta-xylanase
VSFLACALLALGACGNTRGSGPPDMANGGAGGGGAPADVTATVDTTTRHQTLVGFGAAVAFETNFLSAQSGDIYTQLFSDLGLDILRVGNWYQNQMRTDATTSTPFTDDATVTVVQKAKAARGGQPLTILMSSWSPPSYLKSNAMTKPASGTGGTGGAAGASGAGTLVQTNGAYDYPDFGDWWVRSLAAYAAMGVVPDYISIQNEPDFYNSGWETCLLGATEGASVRAAGGMLTVAGYAQALDAVYAAIQASSLASKPTLVGPEPTGIANNNLQRYLGGINADEIGAVAHHLYSGSTDTTNRSDPAPDSWADVMTGVATAAAAAGKPIFMTEYAPSAPTMFDTAWLIHDALTVEGVSAYIFWDLVWAPQTPTTSLVTIASASAGSTYTVNDLYYAVKHFARWTDPGWVRVDATASADAVKVSAFVSPDGGSLTVVVLNSDSAPHVVAVDPGAFSFGTLSIYRTSGPSERTAQGPPGDGNSVTLPPQSLATLAFSP